MKYFVTGGSGLIGRFLLPKLVERQHDVYNFDLATKGDDVMARDHVEASIRWHKPDVVIHLAANSGVAASKEDRWRSMQVSVQGTLNVLEACLEHNVSRVLTASSNHVYGEMPQMPDGQGYWGPYGTFQEDVSPLMRRDWYTVGKICVDMITQGYAHNYGLNAVAVRPTNTYGPGDPHEDHIIPATILSILGGDDIIIKSDGRIKKSYLYGDDCADALIALSQTDAFKGEAVNIVGSAPISVLNLAEQIQALHEEPSRIRIQNEPYDGASEFLSSAKMGSLGWEPKVSLGDGLSRTIAWFREHAQVAV
tara:strand:+ start:7371 stop:8294 length:924 start_codon:yes stop_codon:yes gene_type:complete